MILAVQVRELSFRRTSKNFHVGIVVQPTNCGKLRHVSTRSYCSLCCLASAPMFSIEMDFILLSAREGLGQNFPKCIMWKFTMYTLEPHLKSCGGISCQTIMSHWSCLSLVFNYPGQFRTIQDPIGSITIRNKPRGISNSVHEPLYPLVPCQQALQRLFQDEYPIACQDHENDQHAPRLCDLCKYIPTLL